MCSPRRKISTISAATNKKTGNLNLLAQLEDGEFLTIEILGFVRGSTSSDLITKSAIIAGLERLAQKQSPNKKGIHDGLEDVRREV